MAGDVCYLIKNSSVHSCILIWFWEMFIVFCKNRLAPQKLWLEPYLHSVCCKTKGVLPSHSGIQSDVLFLVSLRLVQGHLCGSGLPFWQNQHLSLHFLRKIRVKSNLFYEYSLASIVTYPAALWRAAGFSARNTELLDHLWKAEAGASAMATGPSTREGWRLEQNYSE